MPKQDNRVLKYNDGENYMKVLFIIYGNLESLLEKISTCYNSPKKPSATKINKHTPSGYLLFTKRVYKDFNNKNIGDYHDFYVQSDTLLLADVFENFRNKCIERYELDPAHFLSVPGLVYKLV